MQDRNDRIITDLMEQLIESGPDGMASAFTTLLNLAMRLEREQHLGARAYERTPERGGYANGYKPKRLDTAAGTLTVQVPKSRGGDEAFYPQAPCSGRWNAGGGPPAPSCWPWRRCTSKGCPRATWRRACPGEGRGHGRVRPRQPVLLAGEPCRYHARRRSRRAALEAWRNRPLGQVRYLFLDARYEKMRVGGVVRDAALFSAIGVDGEGRRSVLGVSVALSEAEVHWRSFLDDLVRRGMRGVEFVTSDHHPGLGAARKAVLPGALWQRCQFHLAQNAIHHAPTMAIRKRIGVELRAVWNARDRVTAETELDRLVKDYGDSAPKLARWLEQAIPEGLTVFSLPEGHRRRMRTANPIERAIQQEIKRRTRKIRVFPNEASLERLATAILVEIDEEWTSTTRTYINMENRDG